MLLYLAANVERYLLLVFLASDTECEWTTKNFLYSLSRVVLNPFIMVCNCYYKNEERNK
jgi:hypothetical protein